MDFQNVIMQLDRYWADQGCVIWQPHNEKVGAGTANPATCLRVLGPEPWNVAYQEPSARPADGRYGQNPNRWGEYFQYQVILKPAPSDNIQLYLDSLRALGINTSMHDVRFVEDNWQSPSLGAWGLGWEVWLDGLEITQYTYFQQTAGIDLNPISLEITYGVERIVMALQKVRSIPEIRWRQDLTYGDIHMSDEVDYCRYNFDVGNVSRLRELYDLFEAEAREALAHGLVLPAHDYLLRCSHTFNVLDARGAIGVTQRATYFGRMKGLAQRIAAAYLDQRRALGYPLAARTSAHLVPTGAPSSSIPESPATPPSEPATLVLEVGTEELPARDLELALEQLDSLVPERLAQARLGYADLQVLGTPRRLAICITGLEAHQQDTVREVKGPPASTAFAGDGTPNQTAAGFARSLDVPVDSLKIREFGGKQYLTVNTMDGGQPAIEVLSRLIPDLLAEIKFPLSMRWNSTQARFSRPIRWLVAVLGDVVVPFEYAGVQSGRRSRGLRSDGDPELVIATAEDYMRTMTSIKIVVDPEERLGQVRDQIDRLAAEVGGTILPDAELLREVTNLVERPRAIVGTFDPAALDLPQEVLVTVMKKHQRYFPVFRNGTLAPYFIAVVNGDDGDTDLIREGNEEVLGARFADARFFYQQDTVRPLSDYVPKLAGLAFHEQLGSYFDKTARIRETTRSLSIRLGLSAEDHGLASRAAELAKADLVTAMVIELTSLQGSIGRRYAERSGEDPRVALAIEEQYLPRHSGDVLPLTWPGAVVALADRIDTLAALAAAGLTPTAAADQYGLRRAALGLVEILVDRNARLPLDQVFQEATAILPDTVDKKKCAEVLGFIQKRFERWLTDRGCRPDVVDAVLAEVPFDPARAWQMTQEIQLRADRGELDALVQAYARSARILRGVEVGLPLATDRLVEPAERILYEQCCAAEKTINGRTDPPEVLAALSTLVEPINNFFDDIRVMHEDKTLRNARLALLQRVSDLWRGFFDPTRIVIA